MFPELMGTANVTLIVALIPFIVGFITFASREVWKLYCENDRLEEELEDANEVIENYRIAAGELVTEVRVVQHHVDSISGGDSWPKEFQPATRRHKRQSIKKSSPSSPNPKATKNTRTLA